LSQKLHKTPLPGWLITAIITGHLSSKEGVMAVNQNQEPKARGWNWGQAGPVGTGSADGLTLQTSGGERGANPHDVAAYKKTSDGKAEIMGPLTVAAFKETDFYKKSLEHKISAQAPNLSPNLRKLSDIESVIATSLDNSFGIGDSLDSSKRILIQSELNENSDMVPKRLLVGHYRETQTPKGDLVAVPTDKTIQIDTVYALITAQKTEIQDFGARAGFFLNAWPLVDEGPRFQHNEPTVDGGRAIPVLSNEEWRKMNESVSKAQQPAKEKGLIVALSNKGALLQPEADKLVGKLHDLPELEASQPNRTSDGKTIIDLIGIGNSFLLDKITKQERIPLNASEATTIATVSPSRYNYEKGKVLLEEYRKQVDGYDLALLMTDIDPATKEKTYRILLGNTKEKGVDQTTGEPVRVDSYSKSFNLENGKTSVFEKPISITIEIPTTGEFPKVRQADIDVVAKKVHEAVEKHEISQAERKDANPHFDALLAKGHSGAAREEGDIVVPSVPAAAGKAIGV
jgi:hypothetical protein